MKLDYREKATLHAALLLWKEAMGQIDKPVGPLTERSDLFVISTECDSFDPLYGEEIDALIKWLGLE